MLENLEVARALSRRYRHRSVDPADLEQVAYVGLVRAVERYDPTRGTDFLSFAVPTISGELKRHFRDRGWYVRPPRRITELQAGISRATEELSQSLGRSPRAREVAEALGCPEEDVIEALACDGAFAPSSLDVPVGHDGTLTLGATLAADEHDIEQCETRMVLGPAVRSLSPRDRRIIELRFFEGCTQEQIGREIGVTQMQVSRLLGRILADLRRALVGDPDSPAGE